MSGHSKWAGIKHKKALVDARKGQTFTKVASEITVAAREGGSDPGSNFRLRLAMQKAREVNMPADNIDRAIKRGTGELQGAAIEEIRYEGYGPGGVAVLVDSLTDNRNRTVAAIRNLFTRSGGSLGETNSVGWMFNRTGLIVIAPGKRDPESLALEAIEMGADDVQVEESGVEVYVSPERLESLRQALSEAGYEVERAEVTMQPTNTVEVEGKHAAAVVRLLEALEDDDDVREVHCNAILPDEVLAEV
ncbi:MAG TPA: YebC/PmpR family DNA-binding transcriptional regulator [Candidatus Dormibacteraeota bacterium]|nr:YebC/PmpR family DNA-binding transcriptional regulator [Candidatus Dormibacteraeota bacterium]